MTEDERKLFKTERKRRKLNQTQVGQAVARQSTISKIEIDPSYEPTLPVWRKALNGLRMTVLEFEARLRGLPEPIGLRDDQGFPAAKASPADEALSTLTEEDRRLLRA